MNAFSMRNLPYLLAISGLLAFSSCMKNEDSEIEKQFDLESKLIEGHLEQNNITATRDNSGIHYEVLKSNPSGTPIEDDDVVSIRYIMRTLEGRLIDSISMQVDSDTAVRFQQTLGKIYPEGIYRGVRLMNEGEKFRFYLPSIYGFSSYSYKTLLPSNATLILEAEVVKVESENDIAQQEKQAIQEYISSHQLEGVTELSSGVFYQSITPGTGDKTKTGQLASVAYKGFLLNGEVFDQSKEGEPFDFGVGANSVIPGFEEGIKQMKKGEKGRIFIPSKQAYGSGLQIIPGLVRKNFLQTYRINARSPYEILIFEVELKDLK